ncbi:uncharacterized protein [Nicotiana tomentosiformis]|uniref:uncharacterized protein n=1 Tax=Nicotiana tomentosiformis TaxID=4098 RepID=UPI00388C4886
MGYATTLKNIEKSQKGDERIQTESGSIHNRHPPLNDNTKVNADGSYIKESGKVGIWGIVRDGINGDFLVPVTCDNNNMTEVLANEFGRKLCNQLGYTSFALELDSTIISNMLTQRGTKNMKLRMVAARIIDTIQIASVIVQQCYKEGNQVADSLAKLTSTTNQSLVYHTYQ